MRKKNTIKADSIKSLLLNNLPSERWIDIAGFEGLYRLSNYGRVKSLAREIERKGGRSYMRSERIRKLSISIQGNNEPPSIQVTLHKEGQRHIFTIPRLVYYYFVSPFDLDDHTLLVGRKDGDYLNCRYRNLTLRNISDVAREGFAKGSRHSAFQDQAKPVNQYSLEGHLIQAFANAKDAAAATKVAQKNITMAACSKERPAGKYYWRYGKPYNKINVRYLQSRRLNAKRTQARAVRQLSLDNKYIQTFQTVGEAAAFVGMKAGSGISSACKGTQKTCKGYVWKYA